MHVTRLKAVRNWGFRLAAVTAVAAAGGLARADLVRFDISASYNYDLVGTLNETNAAPGNLSATQGDHSYGTNLAFTNQGSITSGTALPDDGLLGDYQLGPYDNGTDYLTKSRNAIAFRTHDTVDGVTMTNIISRTVTLVQGQQTSYTGVNLAFVNLKTVHGSTSYRTSIQATYSDGTTVTVFDTGLTGSTGGSLGGGEVGAQGGLSNATDTTTYTNVAPGTGGTYSPSLLLSMDRRLSGGSIVTANANIWELNSYIPVDQTKILLSLTINFQGPASNANRRQQFYVLGISGESVVPEPGSLGVVCVGGAMLLRRCRRRGLGLV